VKISPRQLDAFLKAPSSGIRAVLIFGPDHGLVKERADTLADAIVPDRNDPFRIAHLPGSILSDDPARLADEAAAIPMTGGRRLVRVQEASDSTSVACEALTRQALGDSFVVVEAGDLPTRSSLRKLFESHESLAAIPCYVEDEGNIAQLIRRELGTHGISIAPDALEALSENLIGDRGLARQELAKLILYMGAEKQVSMVEVVACSGDSTALSMDVPIMAAASGNIAELDRALERLFAEGAQAVGLLRVAQNHFRRLALTRARMDNGEDVSRAMKALQPQVFFKQEAPFRAQAMRWTAKAIQQALEGLVQTEVQCKRNGPAPETLCAHALYAVAGLARRLR